MPLASKSGQRSLLFHIIDIFFNIAIIVAIVVVVRTFLISPYQVQGSSMSSTLEDRQYIIINKLAYHVGEPKRGDIVVFRPPNEEKKHYVKRVIGLPGDEVILRGGYVYVKPLGSEEDEQLDESYLDERNLGKTFRHPAGSEDQSEMRYVVPEEHYFLLGDNRLGSFDSRSFRGDDAEPAPFVVDEDIKGRVWFVALPITQIHAFEAPEYNL